MQYENGGKLRKNKNLPNIVKNKWIIKLKKLHYIISELNAIHQQNLVYCDLHSNAILIPYSNKNILSISNFESCKPIATSKTIYSILIFTVPKVLKGKPYTLASNIYSFSMIMWEFTSGIFHLMAEHMITNLL